MFKMSCADFTFPVPDRRTALQLIRALGFDFVDLGLFARSSHFSPGELSLAPAAYTRQVLDDLKAADLAVSDVFLQIGVDPPERAVNDPSPAVRAENRQVFRQALEFCSALGCGHMTGLPGTFHEGCSKEQDLDLAAEETRWRLDECRKAGVLYSVEPHVGSISADVAAARDFTAAVPGLTLTLDYGHFIMAGEDSEAVHALVPLASHLHLRGGAPGRLQTPVAENTIDFASMLRKLGEVAYDGFLAMEYVWIDWNGCNRTDNISETILMRRAVEEMAGGAEERG